MTTTQYGIDAFFIHFGLAVLLFFIVNWIGKKTVSVGYVQLSLLVKDDGTPAFNFLLRILSPVVYLILVAALLQNVGGSKYLYCIYNITIFYWLVRLIIQLGLNRGRLLNWTRQVFYWSISIGLSLWVYSIIEKVDEILPSPGALLEQFWILVILFLYSVFNNVRLSNAKSQQRKDEYIDRHYAKFASKYNDLIVDFFHNNIYEALTYSIMINEDFNRPKVVRAFEYISFWLTGKEHSLGIMQFKTTKYINDLQSLELAMHKIKLDSIKMVQNENYYIDGKYQEWKESSTVREVALKYNHDLNYAYEVQVVFDYLRDTVYKDTADKIMDRIN